MHLKLWLSIRQKTCLELRHLNLMSIMYVNHITTDSNTLVSRDLLPFCKMAKGKTMHELTGDYAFGVV